MSSTSTAKALELFASQLVAQSLPRGIEVYLQPDAKSWCRADIELLVQLAPDSGLAEGQLDGMVPSIGAAAAEKCPAAVAARLTVVRSDQPQTAITRFTALKVNDWAAEPWSATSPVVRLRAARVGWEAQCTNRSSLLDQAQRDPSKAPEWLRGAWDETGQWLANSLQWVGETAAALSSGAWPGEFRARVADFEAAGGGLCMLVRQELEYAGTALGSGRVADASRYIDRTMDLLQRVQAADQAANAYYVGALDRASSHWEVVFQTSKVAFSMTLAAATAGGSLAPSGAGYFAAKYGLFNALEFWVDSTELSLTEAAKKRAIALVVDVALDQYLLRALPNDFGRLAAQGQLEKADTLLAKASSELVQHLPAGLDPQVLKQAAEQALAQTQDEAVRIAIERVFLKGAASLLASGVAQARESTRDIGLSFGPQYLAKRGTPASGEATAGGGLGGGSGGTWGGEATGTVEGLPGSCESDAPHFELERGETRCGFGLTAEGALAYRGQVTLDPFVVSTSSVEGASATATRIFTNASPGGRLRIVWAIRQEPDSRSWDGLAAYVFDTESLRLVKVSTSGPPAEDWYWSAEGAYLLISYSDEGWYYVEAIDTTSGQGVRTYFVTGSQRLVPAWRGEREALRWRDGRTFELRLGTCPDSECATLSDLHSAVYRIAGNDIIPVSSRTSRSAPQDVAVDGKVATFWPSDLGGPFAEFEIESQGYRNTYLLDCDYRRFLWTANINIASGQQTNNAAGAQWRALSEKSTIANAVFRSICPMLGVTGIDEMLPLGELGPALDKRHCEEKCDVILNQSGLPPYEQRVDVDRVRVNDQGTPAFLARRTCGNSICSALLMKRDRRWIKLLEIDTQIAVLPERTNGLADLQVLKNDYSEGLRRELQIRYTWQGSRYVPTSDKVAASDQFLPPASDPPTAQSRRRPMPRLPVSVSRRDRWPRNRVSHQIVSNFRTAPC
jgi:hypothetical protein